MKTGRNAPCPCGSGKKYKHCCLELDRANRGLTIDGPVREAAARAAAWEADIVPFQARFEDDPAARPASVLVTAAGCVLFTEVLACPSAEIDDVAAELDRGISAAAAQAGAWPPAVKVRDGEVAAALARRIRDGGAPIPVQAAALPEVDEVAAAIHRQMGLEVAPFYATQPLLWAGWGHSKEWIAEVFRASAAYYRAAPWRHFDDFPPVFAAMPDGEPWFLSIMGSAGIEHGLAFYSDPDDPDRALDGYMAGPAGRVLSLTFDDGRQLPRPARREIARAGWEVASAEAYPTLLAIGTPAGGLRRSDAQDLIAVLAAVAAWAKAIDLDRAVLSERPWRHAETGVKLEVQGFAFDEIPGMPVVTLETGSAEGPGARPESALESRWREPEGPRPIDSRWLDRFAAELESEGLSAKTVSAHTDNSALFLEYLANWAGVPVAAVHEFDLRSFLFDWYPRKVVVSKTEAGRLFASLRRFFAFLDRREGIVCPWVRPALKNKKGFMARWQDSPGGFWWEKDIADWQGDHFDRLEELVLLPSLEVPGVLRWAPSQGIVEARLGDELQRHWLLWRDELIRTGLDRSDEVRVELDRRAAEWMTAPHLRCDGRTPAQVIEAERAEMARRFEARK